MTITFCCEVLVFRLHTVLIKNLLEVQRIVEDSKRDNMESTKHKKEGHETSDVQFKKKWYTLECAQAIVNSC